MVPKLHMLLLKFGTFDTSNLVTSYLMLMIFINYLPPVRLKLVPVLKSGQSLLKLGIFDILNIPISNLMLKKRFINNYQLLDQNWSQNKKYSKFVEIWANWYFTYADFDFNVKKTMMKYLPPVEPNLISRLKMLIVYWKLAYFMF